MKRHVVGAAIAALCLATSTAGAATVSFTNIKGTWSNASPTGAASYSNSSLGGINTGSARWGNSTGFGQSGYDFVGTDAGASVVVPPSPSPVFDLGTFTHFNQPITGTSISQITLTVNTAVAIDSNSQGNLNFVFDFFHDETTNNANPCKYDPGNLLGVNANGCADRVSTGYNTLSQTFLVGTDIYTIDILGFRLGSNPQVSNQFLTLEGLNNNAVLEAQVKLRSEINNVPEPATLGLIGLSLMFVGARGLAGKKAEAAAA